MPQLDLITLSTQISVMFFYGWGLFVIILNVILPQYLFPNHSKKIFWFFFTAILGILLALIFSFKLLNARESPLDFAMELTQNLALELESNFITDRLATDANLFFFLKYLKYFNINDILLNTRINLVKEINFLDLKINLEKHPFPGYLFHPNYLEIYPYPINHKVDLQFGNAVLYPSDAYKHLVDKAVRIIEKVQQNPAYEEEFSIAEKDAIIFLYDLHFDKTNLEKKLSTPFVILNDVLVLENQGAVIKAINKFIFRVEQINYLLKQNNLFVLTDNLFYNQFIINKITEKINEMNFSADLLINLSKNPFQLYELIEMEEFKINLMILKDDLILTEKEFSDLIISGVLNSLKDPFLLNVISDSFSSENYKNFINYLEERNNRLYLKTMLKHYQEGTLLYQRLLDLSQKNLICINKKIFLNLLVQIKLHDKNPFE